MAGPINKDSSGRAIDEALEYAGKSWFPVNVTILRKVQGRLSTGFYTGRHEELISDLKSDFSLFNFCLKRLSEMGPRNSVERSPTEVISSMEIEKLTAMLKVPEDQISLHRFDPNMKPQMLALKHALISSSTAEALAIGAEIDADLAYVCAGARQVGLTLVAWNYPRIYFKALSTISSNSKQTLDTALFRVLGFSPLQLGVKLTLDWNQCPDVRIGIGAPEFGLEAGYHVDTFVGERIRKFCEIGEALARISDPEHYPSAAAEWDGIVTDITAELGPQGLALVSERLAKNVAGYQILSSDTFNMEISPDKNLKVAQTTFTDQLYEKNQIIKKCPVEVQEKFKEFYGEIEVGNVSVTALNILAAELVPALGFTKGCLYLVDSKSMTVVPTIRIGSRELSQYRPLSCNTIGEANHPVVAALSYSAPLIQEQVYLHSDQVTLIVGTFGNKEKTGVLYLEMSRQLSEADRQEPILYFKALKECINDCLHLR